MTHDKHAQPQSTAPVKGQQGNAPVGEKPPVNAQPVGVIDPNVPTHQVKSVPAGSLPPGQEGAVGLRFIIQPDGTTAHVFGSLEGTGGASVDFGVLPCLTVS